MKKVISILILLTATFLMSGCTASYKSEFMTPQSSMQDQTSILIVTPEPGRYATVEYPTSGIEVASALAQELKQYSPQISTIPTPVTIENITDGDLQKFDYIFIPQILHWEDRATGWSMKPDRIKIRFDIFNNQRQLVNSYLITGRSAYIVWISKTPDSLLRKPIRDMLKKFFNKI
ncbi:DUF4823 domain-containing protein [uncultured Fibrobacter sp.]|uniref:DUF4823 domain-containing protein n=1 Tax=uncultured Fibrobacter sp. TaxID=261512 RepID=UPI0025F63378|nr:DUF4823 domain-containing protein [uncultured Fibrobacter sp.]